MRRNKKKGGEREMMDEDGMKLIKEKLKKGIEKEGV